MEAFEKRISFDGRLFIPKDLRDRLMGLPTNTLRSGFVPRYPELTKYLDQVEELEMKTKLEIVDELVPMMFGHADEIQQRIMSA